jgi:hypothetical protein
VASLQKRVRQLKEAQENNSQKEKEKKETRICRVPCTTALTNKYS